MVFSTQFYRLQTIRFTHSALVEKSAIRNLLNCVLWWDRMIATTSQIQIKYNR